MGLMKLERINAMLGPRMGTPHNLGIKTQEIIQEIADELKNNPPAILKKTEHKKGKGMAEKQRKAILLSKARAKGAKITKAKKGR